MEKLILAELRKKYPDRTFETISLKQDSEYKQLLIDGNETSVIIIPPKVYENQDSFGGTPMKDVLFDKAIKYVDKLVG